jgi:RecJ-like exonuclease
MKKLKRLAYASSSSSLSTSMVVNFVLGNSGKPVAVIYKPRQDLPGSVQISVRGNNDCKVHLGRAVNEIATKLEGNGGGHEKACGAIIPEDNVKKFLGMLDRSIK